MIWLASYPRSGNKLVQQVLHYHFGLPVRTIYDVPSNGDIAPTWDGREESFVKTHELFSNTKHGRSIYIYRHPLDVYCSYARYSMHTNKNFQGLSFRESIAKCICSLYPGIEVGFPAAKWLFLNQIIRFDDLINDPIAVVERILIQFGLNPIAPPKHPLPTFSDLKATADWYYQTGRMDRYVQDLSVPLLRFDAIYDQWDAVEQWLINAKQSLPTSV